MRATSHTCNLRSVLSHDRCRCRICTPDTTPHGARGRAYVRKNFSKLNINF